MPAYTIETMYHLPIYRHRTYVADTLDQACLLSIEDQDWRFERRDCDCAGQTYVSGAWLGVDIAYRRAPLPVPSRFDEMLQRKAQHFPELLRLLKGVNASEHAISAAIAKGEAILAGADDPD